MSRWISCDPKSVQLKEHARLLANSASTVLIRGEGGAGKDLLASMLHYLGPHAGEPLVKIDCASLPAELVESELFGSESDEAPFGIVGRKRGRLEIAGCGTVVLDEVAALSMPVQAKLLHVIEQKRLPRNGGRTIAVEARIIALTSVALENAVSRRSFREDLYYRLNVIALEAPALRERARDIRPLAIHLLQQLAEIHRKPHLAWSEAALVALERYRFPGNVRELRSIIEQAVIGSSAPEIMLEDLPAHVRPASNGLNGAPKSLEELERQHIVDILEYTRGKKTRAAAILGISRKTLLEKRKRYGLG